MSEIRNSITVQNSVKATNNENNIQDIPSIMGCNSSTNININDTFNMKDNMDDELSSSSSCVSDISPHSSHSDISSLSSINSFEPLFRESLASCFVSNNLTHVQGNNILSVL